MNKLNKLNNLINYFIIIKPKREVNKLVNYHSARLNMPNLSGLEILKLIKKVYILKIRVLTTIEMGNI